MKPKKIREFDWSQTPVGSLENWLQSLQINVKMRVVGSYDRFFAIAVGLNVILNP